MLTGRIDMIQEQLDEYQSTLGYEKEYPDMYDTMDMDGNTVEVAHSEKENFEPMEIENVPFRSRGR